MQPQFETLARMRSSHAGAHSAVRPPWEWRMNPILVGSTYGTVMA